MDVDAAGFAGPFAGLGSIFRMATCARCGRQLKDPASIAAGMGPTCAGKASRSDSGSLLGDQAVLNDCGTLQEVGLVCRRLADGRAATNVPHVVVHHSPTGFEWGYAGSGPAELALNVLHQLLPWRAGRRGAGSLARPVGGVLVSSDAMSLHQAFKFRFIAHMPEQGARIPIEDINQWVIDRLSGGSDDE